MPCGSATGRSRSAASATTRRSPASRPEVIARSGSSASAPTAATWRPLIIPARALTVWDIDRQTVCLDDPGPDRAVGQIQPGQPADRPVPQDGGELLVYDLATGQPSRRWRRAGSCATWLSVRMDPDRGHLPRRRTSPARSLTSETGQLVRSISLPSGGSGRSPGAPTAPPWRSRPMDSKIHLWDAATGIRKATLEGSTNAGYARPSTPPGRLLASNGWEGRLRLWDPILGRPLLSLTGRLLARIQQGRTNRRRRSRTN